MADRSENSHVEAVAIQRRMVAERMELFTTNYLVAETHSLALTRAGRYRAVELLDHIDRMAAQGRLAVIRIEAEDERRAREIVRQYDDKDFSLIDASSFAVMERLSIPNAFSFDRHFQQFGFAVLRP